MLMLEGSDTGIQEGVTETLANDLSPPFHSTNINDPDVIHRMQEFHRSLSTLQNMLCNVCLEEFPSFITNSTTTEMCHRCNLDTQTTKLFSADAVASDTSIPSNCSAMLNHVAFTQFHVPHLRIILLTFRLYHSYQRKLQL